MIIDSDGIIAYITIDRFLVQIGGSFDNVVTKNEKSYEVFFLNKYL